MKSSCKRIFLALSLSLLILSGYSCFSKQYKFTDGTPITKIGVPCVDTATSYLHAREITNNDGPDVEKFLRYVGKSGKGKEAWCAAFISYCLGVSNNPNIKIKSAATSSFRKKMIPIATVIRSRQIIPAGSILVFQQGNGMFGHVSMIYIYKDTKFYTIDGNTSGRDTGDQREAVKGGVFPKIKTYQPNARLHIIGVVFNA